MARGRAHACAVSCEASVDVAAEAQPLGLVARRRSSPSVARGSRRRCSCGPRPQRHRRIGGRPRPTRCSAPPSASRPRSSSATCIYRGAIRINLTKLLHLDRRASSSSSPPACCPTASTTSRRPASCPGLNNLAFDVSDTIDPTTLVRPRCSRASSTSPRRPPGSRRIVWVLYVVPVMPCSSAASADAAAPTPPRGPPPPSTTDPVNLRRDTLHDATHLRRSPHLAPSPACAADRRLHGQHRQRPSDGSGGDDARLTVELDRRRVRAVRRPRRRPAR